MKKYYLVNEERNIQLAIKKGRLTGHILHINCLLKYITEEKIGGGRRERRRKHLLDDFKETKGWWKLQYEALGHTL
jgi:hypothetical protein